MKAGFFLAIFLISFGACAQAKEFGRADAIRVTEQVLRQAAGGKWEQIWAQVDPVHFNQTLATLKERAARLSKYQVTEAVTYRNNVWAVTARGPDNKNLQFFISPLGKILSIWTETEIKALSP